MIRGLYSAATALDVATQNQDLVAYNLAHCSNPGFRQKGLTYETFDRELGRAIAPTGDILGTRVRESYEDFTPGGVQSTGNPFDMALESDAFFVLNGPNGPVYTRNGSFRLGAQGQLVSMGGYPVQGVGGLIAIPPAADFSVGRDGSVTVDGVSIGQIQTVRFTNLPALKSIGPTLYRAPQEAGLQPSNGGILQGFRESSNVKPAQAMVEMIQGTRYFEASQRALRAISEAVQLNTKPQ